MLCYKKDDGEIIEYKNQDTFIITIDGNIFGLKRFVKGKLNESYAPVSKEKAAIYLAAIIQGYEPPRSLVHRDRPVD